MFAAKRRWVSVLILALCVSLLAACGGNDKNENGSGPGASASDGGSPEKVTLRFMTWDSGQTLQPYQNAINAFMEKHPNIEVKVESVPDNYDQKLLTALASNTAPDVFMAWNYPLYAPGGKLEDLQPWVERDQYDLGIYYPILMDYMKYDGKLWGLPTTYSPRAIYYNKKLFDEAGVPYPQDGWTWNDFLEAVRKLTKPGQYGFITTPDDVFTMQPYFWSNGGDLISDDGKQVDGVLNSEQNVKTMEFLKQLYDASSKINTADKFSFSPVISVDKEHGYANDPYLKAFAKELEGSDKLIANMRTDKWSQVEEIIRSGIQDIFYNNADIKKTLDDTAKKAQEILQ